MKKLFRKKGGFTLVELLVVLAILAVLIAVAVPTLTGVLKDAKDKTFLQQARAAYVAYEYLRMEKDNVTCGDIAEMIDLPSGQNLTIIGHWEGDTESNEGKPITDFWYHVSSTTGVEGMESETYIHIPLGGKAKVVKRNMDSSSPDYGEFDDFTGEIFDLDP